MSEYVSGNVFVREMRFGKAGEIVNGHAHNFDHTTYVARGALRVDQLAAPIQVGTDATGAPTYEDGAILKTVVKRATDGYNWVLIKAGVHHRITALEDGSIGHCIYSHRNPQAEVVVEYDGWAEAYR